MGMGCHCEFKIWSVFSLNLHNFAGSYQNCNAYICYDIEAIFIKKYMKNKLTDYMYSVFMLDRMLLFSQSH